MTKPVPADTLSRLKAVLGEGGWSQDPDRLAPKLQEWRGRWTGQTPLLALPRSTAQVAAVVGVCAADGVAITPQGGNTGLVAGQIPRGEILLSTEKLTAVRDVDAFDDVMVLEAGVTLARAHEVALSVNRRFPLSLASEGSCTIGGLASTNAGGTAVLRYGVMRDQILGIEAVLPNGEVWNGLKRLRKDNTGYDLKHLLIGAEGTLGIITAASLKLYPRLASRCVAIAAVATPHDAIALLARAKDETGGAVEAFELMSRLGVAFALKNIPGLREPLAAVHPWYVLVETASGEPGAAEAAMERLLAGALERGLIQDAAVAQSDAQAHAFWAVRENQSGGQKPEGAAWKHDVSVPVSKVADFIDQATAAVEGLSPGVRVVAFGHVGDGNVHYDVLRPDGGSDDAHDTLRDAGARIVHDIVAAMDGSISAEHGLGTMKSAEALRYKSAVEIEALRAIRAALDPTRIMNPRVLF
ncbi:FAD-binding oxidoreductase [Caulobacter rhizosphaerae]|jgi:FAD/FMN-containing dehydrogenase|uniref:FAD-binding oxidoreductase n=1 Tax=Caulobacter rhizosphaerae TaxID=2010972 RepID=UPI0013D1CCBD|nr:FAD-binding oxidoreductase [Caulobacter rhizosphaerae]GGL31745.1 D-2-hydroxyacid dehydrogenase [Caulobacter rhizosphaerae]